MITKQTVVDQIEVTRNGTIQIRIALELLEDDVVISSKWHRTTITIGGDVDDQMPVVNNHLLELKEFPVCAADIARIKAVHAAI